MASIKRKVVKKSLDENTTVKKKNGREPEEIIKEGEQPKKVFKPSGTNSVGLSIGVTLNLGDFQSLRIDCWATEEITEEGTREEKLLELTELLQEHIGYVAEEMQDEGE